MRRLEQDLHWGYRLLLMSIHHHAYGFRGKAKGGGFRAYLKAEGIPVRKAYRLIERYRRMQGIFYRIEHANADLLRETMGPPPTPEMLANLAAMCDSDPDTNAQDGALT